MGGRRGSKLVRRARRAFGEILSGACLASIMIALAVPPLPAADRNPTRDSAQAALVTRAVNPQDWNRSLSGDQKLLQLLNRITFGARPGDVERVRKMGIEAFLDQQLDPDRIDDSATGARVAELETYSMSTEELMADYPQPKPAVKQAAIEKAAVPEPATGRMMAPAGESAMQALADTAAMQAPQTPPQDHPAQQEMTAPSAPSAEVQGPRRVMMELGQEELLRAVYSNRQLQEEMVQFWMNHFNIFAPKGVDKWMITSFERDTIRPHALGNFEDLLVATAQSPALLFYLDNWMSSTPDPEPQPANAFRSFRNPWWRPGPGAGRPGAWRYFGRQAVYQAPPRRATAKKQTKRGLNENYGRELMELHTLGADGGYTQQDVIEVARCLTGWTIRQPRQGGGFYFNPRMHDYGEKVVLGHKIRAGGGMSDGLEVLHILANQPATAHHISLELCQRFVADDPPSELVNRVAQTFLSTGGDLSAVMRAILTSPEFFSEAAYHAKIKSPVELVASSLRALGAETDAGLPLLRFMGRMGQPLFQYPAPSGWPDRASTWVDSGALLARLQYAMALAANRIQGTSADLDHLDFGREGPSPEAALDSLAERLTDGTLSPATRAAVLNEFAGDGGGDSKVVDSARGVEEMAALLIASPDFQRR